MDFRISNSVILLNWVIRIFSQIWKYSKYESRTILKAPFHHVVGSCGKNINTFRNLLIIYFLKIIFHEMAKIG
jgi:hypothetical protein